MPGIESPTAEPNQKDRHQWSQIEIQQNYLSDLSTNFPDIAAFTSDLLQESPPMRPECLLTFAIPAYREGERITELLEKNFGHQKNKDGSSLDHNLWEIVIFVNAPAGQQIDAATLDGVKKFSTAHPELNIRIMSGIVEYPELNGIQQRKMGKLYNILATTVVKSNLDRTASDETKSLHAIRTGGADAEGKSPFYVSDVLSRLADPELVQYRSEARLPEIVQQKLPSINFTYMLEETINRIINKSIVGLGTYRTGLYCLAGGFDPNQSIAEEVQLNKKIRSILKDNPDWKSTKSAVHNAFDNPARFLFAHKMDVPTAKRYSMRELNFNDPVIDAEFRAFDWQKYVDQVVEEGLTTFIEKVVGELETVFRQYVDVSTYEPKDVLSTHPIKSFKELVSEPTKNVYYAMRRFIGIINAGRSKEDGHFEIRNLRNLDHFLSRDISSFTPEIENYLYSIIENHGQNRLAIQKVYELLMACGNHLQLLTTQTVSEYTEDALSAEKKNALTNLYRNLYEIYSEHYQSLDITVNGLTASEFVNLQQLQVEDDGSFVVKDSIIETLVVTIGAAEPNRKSMIAIPELGYIEIPLTLVFEPENGKVNAQLQNFSEMKVEVTSGTETEVLDFDSMQLTFGDRLSIQTEHTTQSVIFEYAEFDGRPSLRRIA